MKKLLQVTIVTLLLIGASGPVNADLKNPPPNPDPNTSVEVDE